MKEFSNNLFHLCTSFPSAWLAHLSLARQGLVVLVCLWQPPCPQTGVYLVIGNIRLCHTAYTAQGLVITLVNQNTVIVW